jgi:hypothetical protein
LLSINCQHDFLVFTFVTKGEDLNNMKWLLENNFKYKKMDNI